MPISERHRERKGRNIAVATALFVMIAIFFVASIVKMGGGG